MNPLDTLRQQIATGKTTEAVQGLGAYIQQHSPRYANEVIMHQATHHDLQERDRQGTIDHNTLSIEQKRLKKALLDLIAILAEEAGESVLPAPVAVADSPTKQALAYLREANYAGYFACLDTLKPTMSAQIQHTYATLKARYLANDRSFDFVQQLEVFVSCL